MRLASKLQPGPGWGDCLLSQSAGAQAPTLNACRPPLSPIPRHPLPPKDFSSREPWEAGPDTKGLVRNSAREKYSTEGRRPEAAKAHWNRSRTSSGASVALYKPRCPLTGHWLRKYIQPHSRRDGHCGHHGQMPIPFLGLKPGSGTCTWKPHFPASSQERQNLGQKRRQSCEQSDRVHFLDCTLEWELFAHRFLFPLPGVWAPFSEDG